MANQPNIFKNLDDVAANTVLLGYLFSCHDSLQYRPLCKGLLKQTYKCTKAKKPPKGKLSVLRECQMAPLVVVIGNKRKADIVVYISHLPSQDLEQFKESMLHSISAVASGRKMPKDVRCLLVVIDNTIDKDNTLEGLGYLNTANIYKALRCMDDPVVKAFGDIYKVKHGKLVRR